MTVCGRILDGALFAEAPEDATPSVPWERKAEAECTGVWDQRFPGEPYDGEDWEDWEGATWEGQGEGQGGAKGKEGEGAAEMEGTACADGTDGSGEGSAKAGAEGGAAGAPARSLRVLQELQNRPRPSQLEPPANGDALGKVKALGARNGQSEQEGPERVQTEKGSVHTKPTQLTYNLVDAVQRQSTFFFQVSRRGQAQGYGGRGLQWVSELRWQGVRQPVLLPGASLFPPSGARRGEKRRPAHSFCYQGRQEGVNCWCIPLHAENEGVALVFGYHALPPTASFTRTRMAGPCDTALRYNSITC